MATAVGDGRQAPKSATMGPARPTANAPSVAEAAHLSPLAEAAIRLLPGNDVRDEAELVVLLGVYSVRGNCCGL
jgi:hypothetical protein